MIIDPNVHLSDAVEYLKDMIKSLRGNINMYMIIMPKPQNTSTEYEDYIEELDFIYESIDKKKMTLSREEIEKISVRIEDIAICAFPPSPQPDPKTNEPPPVN